MIRKLIKNPSPVKITRAASSVTAYKNNSEWNSARPYREIPGPNYWELFKLFRSGGLMDGLDFFTVTSKLHERYGNICKLPGFLGRKDTVFVYDPDDIEKIFRNEGQYPIREGLDAVVHHRKVYRKDLYKNTIGLAPSQGKEWWEFRHQVNQIMMQPKATKLYVPKFDEISGDFVNKIQSLKDQNKLEEKFLPLLTKWSLENQCYLFMDLRIGLLDDQRNPIAEQFLVSLGQFFKDTFVLDTLPSIWKLYKTKAFKLAMKNMDQVVEGALHFIQEGKESLKGKQKNGEKGVFEKLIEINEEVALIMAMDSIMAGVDTTSTTFFELLYTLALNPEKQEILREEIKRILPHKDSRLTPENVSQFKYLHACMKESLRLTPLVNNARSAGCDLVIQGFQIPKYTMFVLVHHMHLASETFYKRSKEFIPERFLRENSGCLRGEKTHPFVYLPFGFGSRMCIGKRFAELQIQTLIARIIGQFKVEWNGPEPTRKVSFAQIPTGRVHFKFTAL